MEDLAGLAREHLGLDLERDRPSMAALAAIGLTIQAWRNTSLEDLHAGDHPSGGFPDSDMMRFNIATFRVVSSHVTPDAFDWRGLETTLTDPDRVLPGGTTIGMVAGDEFERLASDIREALAFNEWIERRSGVDHLLALLALQAGLSYKNWYGSPWWSEVVDEFIAFLADPESSAWRYDEQREVEPPDVSDRTILAQTLLDEPESLSHDAIYWCLAHGLGREAAFAGFARWRRRREPDWVDPVPWLSGTGKSR